MKCKAGKCSYTINWRGEMIPCVIMSAPSVDTTGKDFKDCWKEIVCKTEEIYTSEKCQQCTLRKVCNVCPTYSLLETGKYSGVPEYLCEYTKWTIEYFKEELKKMENDDEY